MASHLRSVRHMRGGRTAAGRARLRRTEEEKRRLKRRGIALLAVAAVVCILAAGTYFLVDSRDIFDFSQFVHPDLYNTVEIGGVRCRRRTRIKSYLFMGVDSRGKVGEYYDENGPGQCDVIQLLVIDQNRDTYTMLPLSRDTLMEVQSLEPNGKYLATTEIQLAFAHANGDDREISCENVVQAVSHFLLDQPIDGYLALNMDCIGVINHQLGGVTVTIEDDFSRSDPSLKIGETVKLTDEQAQSYVRGRMTVADGTNENRMKRQEQFLDSASPIFQEKLFEDEHFMRDFYDALGDYMVTSLSGKDISKMAKALRSNKPLDPPQIDGELSIDNMGFKQFKPEEQSVLDAVLELFYEEV